MNDIFYLTNYIGWLYQGFRLNKKIKIFEYFRWIEDNVGTIYMRLNQTIKIKLKLSLRIETKLKILKLLGTKFKPTKMCTIFIDMCPCTKGFMVILRDIQPYSRWKNIDERFKMSQENRDRCWENIINVR